jgi:hypothetical protein
MGIYFRKSLRLSRAVHLNVSKTGISTSLRLGPLTMNSRGRTSLRLAPGISYRTYSHRRG